MKKSDRDFIEREQKATVRDIINDGNDRERFIPSGQRGTSEGGRGGGDPNNFFGNSNPP